MVFITAWHFINGLCECSQDHQKQMHIDPLSYHPVSAFYWYTRATTSGVSWRAQWLFLVGAGAEAIARVLGYTKEGIRSLWIIMDLLSLAYTLVPAYFLLSTILHLEISQKGIIRRKANKKERQTRRLDEEIGWMLPIGVSDF
jgi:phage shock protein PspC (stress-responsive transcriptional regulator)